MRVAVVSGHLRPFGRQRRVMSTAVVAILGVSISPAPSAVANSADNLRTAVTAARASCAPLRSVPLVEQAAEIVNRSTDDWLDHTGRTVPVPDPLPILKDLGYGGGKAVQIEGAGETDAQAIAGLVLIGYETLRDCSFTDYGVSVVRNQTTGHYLTTVVLGGV